MKGEKMKRGSGSQMAVGSSEFVGCVLPKEKGGTEAGRQSGAVHVQLVGSPKKKSRSGARPGTPQGKASCRLCGQGVSPLGTAAGNCRSKTGAPSSTPTVEESAEDEKRFYSDGRVIVEVRRSKRRSFGGGWARRWWAAEIGG